MKQELLMILAVAATAIAPGAIAQTTAIGSAPSAPATAASAPAADAVATLQRACLPILRGAAVKGAAQSAGFRLQDGGWVMPIAGKREIDLVPPDAVNPHVCTLSITAQPADAAAIRGALAAWAAAQSPPLVPAGVDQSAPGAPGWVTSTWSGKTAAGAENVVLTQPQGGAATGPAAASQPAATSAQSTLLVSVSPA